MGRLLIQINSLAALFHTNQTPQPLQNRPLVHRSESRTSAFYICSHNLNTNLFFHSRLFHIRQRPHLPHYFPHHATQTPRSHILHSNSPAYLVEKHPAQANLVESSAMLWKPCVEAVVRRNFQKAKTCVILFAATLFQVFRHRHQGQDHEIISYTYAEVSLQKPAS
jgi:hypothetical protein